MEVEKTTYYQWHLDDVPAGASLWAAGAGHLQGFGHSRRKLLLNDLIPHMVVSGCGTYICNGQTIHLKAGDLFTVWPGLAYEFFEDPKSPWQFYWLLVKGNGREAFGNACGFSPDKLSLTPQHPQYILETLKTIFEYYALPFQFREPFQALSLLYKFAADLRNDTRKDGDGQNGRRGHALLVNEAMTLAETLMDSGINVNELAARLHTSRNNLLAAFREQLRETPLEYLARIRLFRAEDLLLRTEWKLAAISEACGFRNEKYFMRVFKKRHGISPTIWRTNHR